ncbi:MAG: PEP-CTERM sorting domain-containing protein [Symploca sp. SIO3E6]|nr:PEP-CTERM sorting domain-containing protein [Caldora sp. SIO3E6]
MDLLEGGYASFDNLVIASSDDAGGGLDDISVPEPSSILGLIALGMFGTSSMRKSKK